MNHSETQWRSFLRLTGCTLVLAAIAVFAFILIVDPYRNVPFSPALDRAPVTTNQRFSYAAIARGGEFPAAVFGTSTARMLMPEALEAGFGVSFANLAMNSATAWEQAQLFDLWRRSTSDVQLLVLAVDGVWCRRDETLKKTTFRTFPYWMYDDNPWNDLLYLFNDKALEESVRQLEQIIGKRESKYRHDGFGDFLPPPEQWDRTKVLRKIYGAAGERELVVDLTPTQSADINRFPALGLLDNMLAAMPEQSRSLVFFVPYHRKAQHGVRERMPECKRTIMNIASEYSNVHVVDFMIDSEITRDVRNYWDALHYDRPIADRIVEALVQSADRGDSDSDDYRYLIGPNRKIDE